MCTNLETLNSHQGLEFSTMQLFAKKRNSPYFRQQGVLCVQGETGLLVETPHHVLKSIRFWQNILRVYNHCVGSIGVLLVLVVCDVSSFFFYLTHLYLIHLPVLPLFSNFFLILQNSRILIEQNAMDASSFLLISRK